MKFTSKNPHGTASYILNIKKIVFTYKKRSCSIKSSGIAIIASDVDMFSAEDHIHIFKMTYGAGNKASNKNK